MNETLQKLAVFLVFRAQRESPDVHLVDALVEFRHLHIGWFAIARKQNVATYHLFFEHMGVVVLIVDGIAVAVHLVDGVVGWQIHIVGAAINAIFRIEKIGHLHALLHIVFSELEHDVGFLRHGGHHKVGD